MSNIRNLLAAALVASAGNAVAASSVDLAVKGTITPSACTPAISNGGVADFGKNSAKDLRPDWPTYLPGVDLQMTVTCDAATLIAIAAKDNREGSDYNNDYDSFGLGFINATEKLGYVKVHPTNPVADGVAVKTIGSRDGGVTWEREVSFMNAGLITVAEMNTLVPLPVQVLTTDLQVRAAIAPSKNLTLNKEEAIDGSVTLTVHYL